MGMITQQTQFRISDDGVTYEDLGCVQDWTLDKDARAEIDTTCLSSTEREFMFGLGGAGSLSVSMAYDVDGAGQALLEASYASDDAYYFEIEYSDTAGTSGTVKTFQGFVTALSESGAIDDVVQATASIKLTGAITVTAPIA